MNNNFIKKLKISNLSLFSQIIIINLFVITISFVFFGLLNFYLIYRDFNLEDKKNNLNDLSYEIVQYLINDAISKPLYTSDSKDILNEPLDPQASRIIREVELISLDKEDLDPYRTQKIIDSYYKKITSNVKVYNNENLVIYDSLFYNLYTNKVKSLEIYDSDRSSLFDKYKTSYINKFLFLWRIYNKYKYQDLLLPNFQEFQMVDKIVTLKEQLILFYLDDDNSIIIKNMLPLIKNNKIFGVVIVTDDLKEVDLTIAELSFNLFNNLIIIIIIVILIATFYANSIVNPIKKLSFITSQYNQNSSVDSSKYLFPSRGDEIGNLSLNLKIMSDKLISRINELERFAADVSHELKNPLASIKSANEILQKNSKDFDTHTKLISIIDKDTSRMNRLITDISNYTRTKAEIEINSSNKRDINIIDLLNEIIKDYSMNSNNIKFITDFVQEDRYIIFSNYEKIAQIITIILDNAASFSVIGSSILIMCKKSLNTVIIKIADQGPGIKIEHKEKIFERFYKDRNDENNQHSGLGLEIAQHIAKSYGGIIYLQDKKIKGYKGACFVIKLPLKDV